MTTRRREVGRRYYWTYADVEYTPDGWADASMYRPLSCDMITLRIVSSYDGSIREINAWWDGQKWDGIRLRKADKIVSWRLNEHSNVGIDQNHLPLTKKIRIRMVGENRLILEAQEARAAKEGVT